MKRFAVFSSLILGLPDLLMLELTNGGSDDSLHNNCNLLSGQKSKVSKDLG